MLQCTPQCVYQRGVHWWLRAYYLQWWSDVLGTWTVSSTKELAKYVSTLLDQLHRQREHFQIAPRRFQSKERSRRGEVVTTDERTEVSTIETQRWSIVKMDHMQTKGFETTGSGQVKHSRLCLEKDHRQYFAKSMKGNFGVQSDYCVLKLKRVIESN